MRRSLRTHWALLLAVGTLLGPAAEGQTDGSWIAAERILFGQSAAFSGPARDLGENMRLGIEAAFHATNERGGVHGRRLELLSLDDAYEPEAAIANTRKLISDEGVFALIGAVGHTNFPLRNPGRRGRGSSLCCALHRCPFSPRGTVEKYYQPARLLLSGDRKNGRPPDPGPEH